MTMIDVYAAAGTLPDSHALARDLAAAVMRWEQVPEEARVAEALPARVPRPMTVRTPIGTPGFEPGTPATQRRCATRLRHVPSREAGARPPPPG